MTSSLVGMGENRQPIEEFGILFTVDIKFSKGAHHVSTSGLFQRGIYSRT